jgi:hypothetical protein
VAQIVKLGGILAVDGRHPQALALAIGLGLLAGWLERGPRWQRTAAQIGMMLVDRATVAVEAATHSA